MAENAKIADETESSFLCSFFGKKVVVFYDENFD
jgi:hypothetical protein